MTLPPPPSLAQLRRRRKEILAVAADRGASNVRVFGSVARGEARDGSDVDLLVDLEEGRSLFDLGGLYMDLVDLLGYEVDAGTPASLKERIRTPVLTEAVPI
jgi:uncharacterized protein